MFRLRSRFCVTSGLRIFPECIGFRVADVFFLHDYDNNSVITMMMVMCIVIACCHIAILRRCLLSAVCSSQESFGASQCFVEREAGLGASTCATPHLVLHPEEGSECEAVEVNVTPLQGAARGKRPQLHLASRL